MPSAELDGYTITRLDRPDQAFIDLLEGVDWGTTGLLYRLRDAAAIYAHWPGAELIALRQGDALVAVSTVVPRSYAVDGFTFTAAYLSLVAVRRDRAGAGVGRAISAATRRLYLDEARGPRLLYCFIEDDNARSIRLHERAGFTRWRETEGALAGWLCPRPAPGLRPARPDERDALLARISATWAGHLLNDLEQSFSLDDYVVLERDGRVVAGAQLASKDLRIVQLDGWDGRLLLAASPLLGRLDPFFRTDPHRQVWLGCLFFDTDADWRTLAAGVQRARGASSLVLYLDAQSPVSARLRAAGLGPVHRLVAGPRIGLYAMQSGLPDAVVARLRAGPLWSSPLDAS